MRTASDISTKSATSVKLSGAVGAMAVREGTAVAAPVPLATTTVTEDAVCMSSVVVVTLKCVVGSSLAVMEGAAEVREMLCRVRVGPETLDGAVGEAEGLPVAGRYIVVCAIGSLVHR